MKNDNKSYFEKVAERIDVMEGRVQPRSNSPEIGEVDGDSGTEIIYDIEESGVQILPNRSKFEDVIVEPIQGLVPSVSSEKLDGVVELYKELNNKYGLSIDVEAVTDITKTFKAIINPEDRDAFEIYLREHLGRLRLACLSMISNTVYILISKLSSPDVLSSLTITERVALCDRMFEYMDKINNMTNLLPKGDTHLELTEIAQNKGKTTDAPGKVRNRDLEAKILAALG